MKKTAHRRADVVGILQQPFARLKAL